MELTLPALHFAIKCARRLLQDVTQHIKAAPVRHAQLDAPDPLLGTAGHQGIQPHQHSLTPLNTKPLQQGGPVMLQLLLDCVKKAASVAYALWAKGSTSGSCSPRCETAALHTRV